MRSTILAAVITAAIATAGGAQSGSVKINEVNEGLVPKDQIADRPDADPRSHRLRRPEGPSVRVQRNAPEVDIAGALGEEEDAATVV